MLRHWLWGPYSPLGLIIAVFTVAADQANKIWALYFYDLGAKGTVTVTPFFEAHRLAIPSSNSLPQN